MTNPDRCREEFEKWRKSKHMSKKYDNGLQSLILELVMESWDKAFKEGSKATARRCVEICRDRLSACVAGDLIEQEFGLQGE